MVPTHFARLLELSDEERAQYDISSLRFVLHSGAACPVALKARILDALPTVDIWEFYGFSEAGRGSRLGAGGGGLHPGGAGGPLPRVGPAHLRGEGDAGQPRAVGWV